MHGIRFCSTVANNVDTVQVANFSLVIGVVKARKEYGIEYPTLYANEVTTPRSLVIL